MQKRIPDSPDSTTSYPGLLDEVSVVASEWASGEAVALKPSRDYIIARSGDTLVTYDTTTYTEQYSSNKTNIDSASIIALPGDTLLAGRDDEAAIERYDTSSPEASLPLQGSYSIYPGGQLRNMAYNPDGDTIYACVEDGGGTEHLHAIDYSDPANPAEKFSTTSPGSRINLLMGCYEPFGPFDVKTLHAAPLIYDISDVYNPTVLGYTGAIYDVGVLFTYSLKSIEVDRKNEQFINLDYEILDYSLGEIKPLKLKD